MAKNRGLGRGLDIIFDDNSVDEEKREGIRMIRLSQIEPNRGQPRKTFDSEALSNLADSIGQSGVLQPILVRETEGGMFTIIAGERRWRASKLAGLVEIPAMVVDADEFTSSKLAMIENLQREDLNPCEEARGYAEMMKKFSMTQEEVASQIGKSRSAVANSLRLMELPPEVLDMVADGVLSAGHGRTLLGLRDKMRIPELAEKVVRRSMSVRELEAAVKAENRSVCADRKEREAEVDYIADLEEKVTETLGRRCKIVSTAKRKTVTLEFTDNEDLEALLTSLCGHAPIED